MGGGDSGGSSTNTVQKADPWSGQQPYLQGGTDVSGNAVPGVLPEAAKLYQNNPLQFYSGQTYADLSPETQLANSMQTTRAMNGSPVMNASNQSLQDTLSGKYLDINTNPYLMPAAQNIMSQVLPQVNSQFAASGRGQSGLASRAASQGATDALATQAFNNYNNERQRQMQASVLAPAAAQADYMDAAKLAEVGTAKEDFNQQGINEAMQRFQFQNQAPWQTLGQYNSMVQGNYGNQIQTAVTPPRRAIGTGMLGGGIAGAGLGAMYGMQPNNGLGLSTGTGALAGGAAGSLLGGLL